MSDGILDQSNLDQANNAVHSLEETHNEPQDEIKVPEPQESPEETLARQSGWRPKEEWDEGKGEWIDAAEFNRRGPLFDTIGKLKDEIRDYKKSADALIEHNKQIQEHARKAEERGREKALKELEERRREAVQDGDLELFEEIDKEMAEYKKVETPSPNVDPAISEWIDKNDWFEKDEAMTAYMIHKQNENLGKGHTIEEALRRSEEAVKKEFAHRFENPNKQRGSGVTVPSGQGKGDSYTINDLPANYRPVYQAIARKMDMPINEYVKQLKELGAM